MIGAFFLPVALFLFSWGSGSHTHWMAPVISLFLFGIGGIFIFQSILRTSAVAFTDTWPQSLQATV